jgi:hypothetical protein
MKVNETHSRKLNFEDITNILFRRSLEMLIFCTKTLLPHIDDDIINLLPKIFPYSVSNESTDPYMQAEVINSFLKLYVDHKFSNLGIRFSNFFIEVKNIPETLIKHALENAVTLLKGGYIDHSSFRSFIIRYQFEGMTKEDIDCAIAKAIKESTKPKDFIKRFRN